MKPQDEKTAELEKLVKLAKKGDEVAIGELITRTKAPLHRFCLYLCRDPEFTQDLAQETYMRALDEIASLKDSAKFMSWLYRIARNLFLDHVKSPANAPKAEIDEEIPAGGGDLEFAAHLMQVLQKLEPEDRLLLLLVDLEERSYQEAAEIMGLTESTVKFRLHHIRKEFINKYND
jgi:RNA polymerase sigma-70 factor, ECF subfamily